MKLPVDRFCMVVGALLVSGACLALPASQFVLPVPAPKPAPGPATTPTTPATTIPAWTPPAYPQRVSMRSIKPSVQLQGDQNESVSLSNSPTDYKIHTALNVNDGVVVDLGAGARLFCLPEPGAKTTKISLDGWITTHGSLDKPAFIGAYSGRVDWEMSAGAVRGINTVFKDVDFNCRGGMMDFQNCLFVNCTIAIDGSTGGQLDMTSCTFNVGAGKTAITVVRSVRGPICHWREVKFDGYAVAIQVDAYDAAMARTVPWDLNDLEFVNISGKAVTDSDPMPLVIGHAYIMGAKSTKEAMDQWVELKPPTNNMTGTPAVTLQNVSPTEINQAGTKIVDPTANKGQSGGDGGGGKAGAPADDDG
ncbi:MAG: hypothetical protein ACREJ2_10065 [Planctomycetota bacterium]